MLGPIRGANIILCRWEDANYWAVLIAGRCLLSIWLSRPEWWTEAADNHRRGVLDPITVNY